MNEIEVVETYIDEDKVTVQNNKPKIDVGKVNPLVCCATIREYWKPEKKVGTAFNAGKELLQKGMGEENGQ